MAKLEPGSEEFVRAAEAAGAKALQETLAAGVPVFYKDEISGMYIMEQPSGRRFEIRLIPGAPAGNNYELLRELTANAA